MCNQKDPFLVRYLSENIDCWPYLFILGSASHGCPKLYAKLFGIILYSPVTLICYSVYVIWDIICSMEEDRNSPREGFAQILLVTPWRGRYSIFFNAIRQSGRYVYNLYARDFSYIIYFHANNSKEILKSINLELEIMTSNSALWRKIIIDGYTIILILHEQEFKQCLLWQSLIYDGRWEPLRGKLRKFFSHIKLDCGFKTLCIVLRECNSNFHMLIIPKEIIYIVCIVIVAKSYALWNWKFCHDTPSWRKNIIV